MANLPEPDKTYICPSCGQKAVIGAHFCQPFDPPPKAVGRKRSKKAQSRTLYAVVGALMVVLFLWRWMGPGSLVVVALGLLGFLFVSQPRTGKGNQAKHAASSSGSAVENKDLSTDNKSDSKTSSPPPGKSKR